MGYTGGFVRKPLTELSQQDKEAIKELLNKSNVVDSGIGV